MPSRYGILTRTLDLRLSYRVHHGSCDVELAVTNRWNEHAEFIDRLVEENFIWMGGPFPDDGGSLVFFNAESETEVREKMKNDPWQTYGILKPESIKRWQIFIDPRTSATS